MEIAVNGGTVLIDDKDLPLVQGYTWRLNADGYATTSFTTTVFMHRLINGTPPDGFVTDHIDGNPQNNRRSNLRMSTKSINALNSKTPVTNTSGYRGVSRLRDRWKAKIVVDGKEEYLGCFDDPAEASKVYETRRAEVLEALS